MTPQQRLQLFAARTSETAAELAAWLRDHAGSMNRPARGLEVEVEHAVRELITLKAAVDQPSAVGIVGTGAPGRQALVLDLLKPHARLGRPDAVTVGFPGLPQGFDLALHILPPDRERCASLTYRDHGDDRSPPGHPLKLSLLSELEVIRILAGIHLGQANPTLDAFALVERLDVLFAEATGRLHPSALPGLGPTETRDLAEFIGRNYPEHPLPLALNATGYWDRLAAIAAYLPGFERQRLLAVLWGEDAGLTLLFTSLCNGLDKLSHALEVYTVLDALVRRDASSGWFQRHPESVLSSSTLNRIGTGGTSPDETVSITRRTGQALEIDRPVLAALLADLSLRIETPAVLQDGTRGPSDRIDVIDFPSPQPFQRGSTRVGGASSQGRHLSLAEAVTRFAHAKTTYLFERAVERHAMTSVLVPVDGSVADRIGDVSWLDALEGWIERAQGPDAVARERFKPGLFITVALPEADLAEPGKARSLATQRLELLFGGSPVWLSTWTPDRPLPTVLPILSSPGTYRAEAGASPALPGLSAAQEQVAPFPAPWLVGTALSPRAPDALPKQVVATELDPIELLMSQIDAATNAQARHRQLSMALSHVRRRLKHRLQRFNLSSDPAMLAEWRRQSANVAAQRLGAAGRSGRLARLEQLLVPGPDVLATVVLLSFREEAGAALTPSDGTRALVVHHDAPLPVAVSATAHADDDAPGRLDRASRTADRVVTTWLLHLRQLARSSVLARRVRVPLVALETLVDELALSSDRAGLVADLTDLMRRTGALRDAEPQRSLRVGTLAQRLISIYIETLKPRFGRSEPVAAARTPHRPGYFGASGDERLDWCDAIGNIADGNSVTAHILSGSLGHDRELAELVASLSASSFEGEP